MPDHPSEDQPGYEPDDAYDSPVPGVGGHRAEKRGRALPGCLAVLLALVVVVGGLWFGGSKGYHALKDALGGGPADFAGPGTGKVTFQVHRGETATAIGRNLKSAGVVKSVDAFVDAANADPKSSGIQVGYYVLKKQMKASDALALLVNPKNLVQSLVTIPEGYRVADIVARLTKETKFSKQQFEKALASGKIGLPDYAHGNPEGYLFPATYTFPPGTTPVQMLTAMVDRWKQALGDNSLAAEAKAISYTPEQVMTVASLVQAEGRGRDMGKIARVIYNRVENPGAAGQTGRLQIDATVNYALGRQGVVAVSSEDQQVDSPYNTYLHAGLPPGPIGSPGDDAIQAALHPTPGDWYYYVTVNLKTGETKFASSYAEFLKYKAEYKRYCETQSDRC
ncbi:endolytic transglycosylase MltG [Nocardioides sp. DS6]|uniref:Endolytic murein transglycosylase n=1 Tax=Nocardioides eburneus TaxID=3231482 RepID=A0ABV3T1L1_9ACTN